METNPIYLFLIAFIVIIFGLIVIQTSADNIEQIDISSDSSSQSILIDNASTSTLSPIGNGITSLSIQTYNNSWLNANSSLTGESGDGIIEKNNRQYGSATTGITISVWANFSIQNSNISNLMIYGNNPFYYDPTKPYNLIFLSIGNNATYKNQSACFFLKTGSASATPVIGGNTNYTCSNHQLNDTGWNHIVAVYNYDNNISIYINGVLEGSHEMSGAIATNLNTKMAAAGGTAQYNGYSQYHMFNGDMDELKYWKRSLNDSEIGLLYENGRKSEEVIGDLFTWYKFDENSGSVVHDLSGSGEEADVFTNSGGGWQNDGVLNTLTEGVDYTLTDDTFELTNEDYAWSGITASWDYLIDLNTSSSQVAHLIEVFMALGILGFILLIINYYRKQI